MPGEEVANEDIVKGYKVDTDTFVEVSKEELENVALESTRTIEIDEFVDKSEIDPRYLIQRRERGRLDGGAAAERGRRCCGDPSSEEAGQLDEEGVGRPEGDADADRRQKADEGDRGEEAGGADP
jgi:hypothetical protein